MDPPRGAGGPRPGPPSDDAPSGLRAIRVTASAVELSWADNAQGEVAFVVQRCSGPDGTDFVNAVGRPGADITTAIDTNVEPGKTYRYRVYAVFPTAQGPRGSGPSNVITVQIPSGAPR